EEGRGLPRRHLLLPVPDDVSVRPRRHGNIGGVATAIAFGGPGAVFWMWVSGFLGASTSFIECTLGQIYKEKDPDTGEYRGGPAFYFERAYKHKAPGLSLFYAILFAV